MSLAGIKSARPRGPGHIMDRGGVSSVNTGPGELLKTIIYLPQPPYLVLSPQGPRVVYNLPRRRPQSDGGGVFTQDPG